MQATTHKPFKVIRLHNAREVAAYYEAQMTRMCVDRKWLRSEIAAAYTVPQETIVAEHATREEADANANLLNNPRQLTPGISYRAEYCDI
jgi:hypothetical protein